jgi:hypothetical protein
MIDFLRENSGSVAFVAGAALIISILLRRNWAYFAQQPPESRAASAAAESHAFPPSPARDLNAAQVEIYDAVRDMKGELDTKIVLLQQLVIQARQEAERLEQALAAAEHERNRHG